MRELDILYTPNEIRSVAGHKTLHRGRRGATPDPEKLWPGGEIPYIIDVSLGQYHTTHKVGHPGIQSISPMTHPANAE